MSSSFNPSTKPDECRATLYCIWEVGSFWALAQQQSCLAEALGFEPQSSKHKPCSFNHWAVTAATKS